MKVYLAILFTLMFCSLGACQKKLTDTPNNFSADASSISSSQLSARPQNIETSESSNVDWVACPAQRPEICTMQYMPVCATLDTGIRCVTTPCPSQTTKTFGNGCNACADSRALGYTDGACPAAADSE